MADQPTGTVTFLFTDIEGSTRRWEQYPEAMRLAVARHDALLRGSIEGRGGYVFKTVGDAFCAAFATAADALSAAVDAQLALHTASWGEVGPLRVRMALHTGAAEERDRDYFGPPVNRVARLLSAGHGGQTLLSQTAYDLVRDVLGEGMSLRDLGEHRLKDLTRPEQVFELRHPHLPADFPRLRTLDARPNNLPQQPTPLIGREQEGEAARTQLLRPEVRLLTLTGPGGTGKTRLGLQVAADCLDDFAGGVFFVPLAPINDPTLVASTIAQTLGLRETGGQPPLEGLKDYLRDKQLLLLLDNFEQVAAAAPLVADLLATCPMLTMLVTSRTVLRLRGEHEYPVPPLALPDLRRLPPIERLSQYAAVALFIERSLAVRPDFAVTNENAPAVAEICHRLDGLPLAIELAAARSKLLSPQALLARLDHRLRLLTGGARDLPARQQTLRDAIAWSYDLLEEQEQRLFRRLAVFVGGCTLEAAEAVCNPTGEVGTDVLDGVTSLVDKSLLRQDEQADGEPRFVMLETVREYGLECLEASGEAEALGRQHAAYYLALAEEAGSELWGPRQVTWLNRLEQEHDNLRAALRRRIGSGEIAQGTRLAGALIRFWQVHGHLSEGRAWLAEILPLVRASSDRTTLVTALHGAADLARGQGDAMAARPLYEESLALDRELDNQPGVAEALFGLGSVAAVQGDYAQARLQFEESLAISKALDLRSVASNALGGLAQVAMFQGDSTTAGALYQEILASGQEASNTRGVAWALRSLGRVAFAQGDYPTARRLYEESLTIYRDLGERQNLAGVLGNLGTLHEQQGNYVAARALREESLAIYREVGDRGNVAWALHNLAWVAMREGDYGAAHDLCQESLTMFRALGERRGVASALRHLGRLAYLQGNYEASSARHEESLAVFRELGEKGNIASSLNGLGEVARTRGDYRQARVFYEEGLALNREVGAKPSMAIALHNLGHVAQHEGDFGRAAALFREALATEWDLGRRPHVAEVLAALAGAAAAQGQGEQAARLFGAAEAQLDALNTRLDPSDHQEYDRNLGMARTQLDAETFAAAWAEGQAMTLEQAVAYALVPDAGG